MKKIGICTILLAVSACGGEQSTLTTTSTTTIIQSETVSDTQIAETKKAEAVQILFEMPEWCENIERLFNAIQVCGVAKHPNLQSSRMRSEMDARKQLARRISSEIDETITESSIGSSTSMQSTSTLRSKVTLGSYEIDQQKTIQSGTDYITFTKVIQYFRRNQ